MAKLLAYPIISLDEQRLIGARVFMRTENSITIIRHELSLYSEHVCTHVTEFGSVERSEADSIERDFRHCIETMRGVIKDSTVALNLLSEYHKLLESPNREFFIKYE